MTNQERADRLMADATTVLQELPRLVQAKAWNLAVRRSQEIVELVLKALLSAMAVEYPKVHDVGARFADLARVRSLTIDEDMLEWVAKVSRRLARMRGPAFYSEEQFTERDAMAAVGDAQRVAEFGRGLLARVRKPEGAT